MQKISSIHKLILKIHQVLESHELNKCPSLFLTTPTQKSLKQLLPLLNLHQHAKHSFFQFINEIQLILEPCPVTRLGKPILGHAYPKHFNQLLIYVNLHQHVKIQTISI